IAPRKPHALDRDAERIGCDLCQHRSGARPDLLRARLDEDAPFTVDADAGPRRLTKRREDRARHSIADQVASVAHRSGLGQAPRPAEPCRPLLVTLAQLLRREGLPVRWIDLRVILEPQRE